MRLIRSLNIILVLLVVSQAGCRDVVIRSRAGEISRGTYDMLFAMYKDEHLEQVRKGQDAFTLEKEFLEKLKSFEALGSLALDLKIETQEYYSQYLALHRKFRYSKAAFAWWRQKLGDDFSFADVFNYYDVKVNPDKAVDAVLAFREGDGSERETVLGHWQRGTITLANLRSSVTSVEHKTFVQLDPRAMRDALPEKIRSYLALVAHDDMRRAYRAYESELQRWDLCQVADKFVRVKYGIAGKGIYPDEPMPVAVTMEEIYDQYHRNLNRYARLESVTIEEYAAANQDEANTLMKQLMIGEKLPRNAQKRTIRAYGNPDDFREKETRTDADNTILEAAYKSSRIPAAYQRGGRWYVAAIVEFRRAETPAIEKYSQKIEQDIRLNLLRRQYEIDLSDKKEALRFAVSLPGV